jgi:3-deoxy-D-manno-octulosonic-acid transferase
VTGESARSFRPPKPQFGGRFWAAWALYNFLLLGLFVLLFVPALAWREFRGRFLNRLGFRLPRPRRSIWLHSPSVGEALAIRTFVSHLREAFPGREIVLTTFTSGGRQVAKQVAADHHLALPYDLWASVLLTVRALKPELFLVVEGDYWPNLVTALHLRRVPVVAINGRVSEKALRGQRRARWLSRGLFGNLSLVCAAGLEYIPRYIELGVKPERIVVTGNLKYDNLATNPRADVIELLAAALGKPIPANVLLAASTHAGEEDLITEAYVSAREARPGLKLVVAPRYPERAGDVVRILEARGLRVARRSELPGATGVDAVVLDTLGELAGIYPIGEVAVIGGSFIPRGGQNMVEAAYHGCVAVWGPYVENFPVETAKLVGRGGVAVKDADGLRRSLRDLYAFDDVRERLSEEARTSAREMMGASTRTLDVLRRLMETV